MKKQFSVLLLAFLVFSTGTFAQKSDEKPLTILKFYPLGLVTNSLQLGFEKFNKDFSRSTNVVFGVRYKKGNGNIQYDANGNSFDNYNNWAGASILFERRIYIPKFKSKFIDENPEKPFKYGVYLAPFLKADYNVRDFDNSFYSYNNANGQSNTVLVRNYGKISYLGGTAGLNIGYQFTLFQYMYIDTYLGGGLRLLSKKENVNRSSQNQTYYSGDYGAIIEFVDKAGVVPNAGITLGVSW
ncbi:MAG: hypothetical protein ACK4NY_22780 [Spirosomataceae bacterium]